MRPTVIDYQPFAKTYVDLALGDDIQTLLPASLPPVATFLKNIPEEKMDYAYAKGKWTIKQVLQHCIDTERIMTYRALCIARGEQQNLPGFDENSYAATATATDRLLADLTAEMLLVRQSTILLFQHFSPSQLASAGKSNNHPVTTNALGYIITGHFLHHVKVLRERYL